MPNTPKVDPGKPNPQNSEVPKKHRDKLNWCRTEIGASRNEMNKDNRHREWREWIRMYSENGTSDDPNVDRVEVPIAFANINVLRSALTVNNPSFTINPRNEASAEAAMLCEEVINYEWYHHGHQEQIRSALDDMLIIGHGWIKLGYSLKHHGKTEDVPELASVPSGGSFAPFAREGFSESFDDVLAGARSVVSQEPGYFGEPLTDAGEAARQLAQEGGIILDDRPYLERVSPFEMFVDPSATSLHNAQWIAQRVPVRKDVAVKNEDWQASVRRGLSAGQKSLAEQDEGTKGSRLAPDVPNTPGDSELEWVIVWELYDLQEGTWCQFDDHADDFLRRPEPMPYKMGHPFKMVVDYQVPDRFYPIGEIERIAPLQQELNNTRSQLINDRKQYKQKWLVDDKYLKDDAGIEGLRHVLTSSDDNLIAAIQLQGQQTDMGNIISPVPARELDPDLYNVSSVIRSDINEVTGVTEYQRGGGSTGASTATEAAIINDGALARLKEKQGRVEKFMGEAARGLLQLKLQYMSSRKVIRIVAGGGSSRFTDGVRKYMGLDISQIEEIFQSYNRDDLQGEFDLIVEAGSSSAFNETQRRRAAQEFFATMLPLFGQGMVNEAEVIAYYAQHGLDIPNAQRFFPQAQQQEQPQGGTPYPAQQGPGGAPTQPQGSLPAAGGIPEAAIGPPIG